MTATPPKGTPNQAEASAERSAGRTPGSPAGPSIVAMGGGHGLATTLKAARLYAGRVTAVVSVADDGGSSGRLRQIAGIPAPGDLRRCLVAMAGEGSLWATAFEYRFPTGELEGHALGNLLIAGLANVTGDFTRALDVAGGLLGAAGRVLPATSVPVVLKADVAGTEVVGQLNVSTSPGSITSVSIVPPDAAVPDDVVSAVSRADQVVMGPGSLFTSVLAVTAVPGIRDTLTDRCGARRIYVCNLRPQLPETAGFDDADHLRALIDHGVPVDVMVVASNRPGAAATGQPHRPKGSEQTGDGPRREPVLEHAGHVDGVEVVRADIAREDGSGHDPERLAAVLRQLT
jgi:uncharacterized cofD-like protein